jgi:orotate phosphoribosyltransferase
MTSTTSNGTWALDDATRHAMRQALRRLLEELAVRQGRFVLSSGAVSDFYVDCRVVTMLPRGMTLIGALMLDAIADLPDVKGIGGLTLGADPIAAAVAMASAGTGREVPMFIVRKEPKGHGTRQLIEGPFPSEPGAPVVIVEDVITTGGSVMKAIQAVERETEARVARVVAIVDREEGGAEALRRQGYDVRALFTRSDFVRP